MNCAEAELLICDYATLRSAERFELERHMADCPSCAQLARDSAAAVAFMASAADVEPPPELITKILFDAPWAKEKQKSKTREWLRALMSPILHPKFAMGMAMTVLSLSMLSRFVTPVRQIRPADLRPAAVWSGIEERAVRTWARSVKFYENLKIVYQIQTTLKEWQQQAEDPKQPAEKPADERKLPVKPPASPGAPAE
jgi:hypothetical protein